MSFDGSPRSSQINPYSDPLSAYSGANAARADRVGKPMIQSLSKDEKVKALQREEHDQTADEDEDRHAALSEEELEEIMLLAKLRGVMNFALDPEIHYEFRLNPQSGLVELAEVASGKVMLKLSPDEMATLAEKLHHAEGRLADREG